jgi:hypothetical protein
MVCLSFSFLDWEFMESMHLFVSLWIELFGDYDKTKVNFCLSVKIKIF